MLITTITVMTISALGFIRNIWVGKHRIELIESDDFDRLPSHGKMIACFWIWNVREFLK